MRGEIWTMRDDLYASKARPVVIVQSDRTDRFDSIVLCLLTTYDSSSIPTRVRVEPTTANGLERTSWVMTDKIASVGKDMLGRKIGALEEALMLEVSRQLRCVLGLDEI